MIREFLSALAMKSFPSQHRIYLRKFRTACDDLIADARCNFGKSLRLGHFGSGVYTNTGYKTIIPIIENFNMPINRA